MFFMSLADLALEDPPSSSSFVDFVDRRIKKHSVRRKEDGDKVPEIGQEKKTKAKPVQDKTGETMGGAIFRF